MLDGKTTKYYNQRVEPSVKGGEKMAKALLKRLGLLKKRRASKSPLRKTKLK